MKTPSKLLFAACALWGSTMAMPQASAQRNVGPKNVGPSVQTRMSVTTGRGRLGAQVITMSEDLRRYFAAPVNAGLLVDQVLPDSPAARAGLATGDVIVAVGATATAEVWDIFQALSEKKKGDDVALKIIRNKKPRTLTVTLDDSPSGHSMRWRGGFTDPLGSSGPWNPGQLFKDDKNFPFSPMQQGIPDAVQEKIRRLEERLEKLEGARGNSGHRRKTTKPPKQLKGAARGPGKHS